MQKTLSLIVASLLCIFSFGQFETQFILTGKITFERKTNVHRLYFTDSEMDSWDEMFKKAIPQFQVNYFELLFGESKSLYRQTGDQPETKMGFWGDSPGSKNTVFKDFATQQTTSQKQIFESQFLLKDSINEYEWKLQPETRTIAGFECKKAITKICDSVVVVAFYTEEIVSTSGPESFGGLPGVILGLAVPRLYTTWFATKVELIKETEMTKIAAPTKGKGSTSRQMLTKIDEGINDWGRKYRDKSIWFASL